MMIEGSKINELITSVIDKSCDSKEVRELIKKALQYELDIWNRKIFPSDIKSEYEFIIEKIIKDIKK